MGRAHDLLYGSPPAPLKGAHVRSPRLIAVTKGSEIKAVLDSSQAFWKIKSLTHGA
jgi:hypothetical protein